MENTKSNFIILNNKLIAYTGPSVSEIKVPEGVEEISNGAFAYLDFCKSIIMPSTLLRVEFSNRIKETFFLENLDLSKCDKLEKCDISQQDKLKTLKLPLHLTDLNIIIFCHNADLDFLELPATLKKIRIDSDKSYYPHIKKIKFDTLNNDIIHSGIFAQCDTIESTQTPILNDNKCIIINNIIVKILDYTDLDKTFAKCSCIANGAMYPFNHSQKLTYKLNQSIHQIQEKDALVLSKNTSGTKELVDLNLKLLDLYQTEIEKISIEKSTIENILLPNKLKVIKKLNVTTDQLTIPANVELVESKAFYDCKIKEIDFSNCENVTFYNDIFGAGNGNDYTIEKLFFPKHFNYFQPSRYHVNAKEVYFSSISSELCHTNFFNFFRHINFTQINSQIHKKEDFWLYYDNLNQQDILFKIDTIVSSNHSNGNDYEHKKFDKLSIPYDIYISKSTFLFPSEYRLICNELNIQSKSSDLIFGRIETDCLNLYSCHSLEELTIEESSKINYLILPPNLKKLTIHQFCNINIIDVRDSKGIQLFSTPENHSILQGIIILPTEYFEDNREKELRNTILHEGQMANLFYYDKEKLTFNNKYDPSLNVDKKDLLEIADDYYYYCRHYSTKTSLDFKHTHDIIQEEFGFDFYIPKCVQSFNGHTNINIPINHVDPSDTTEIGKQRNVEYMIRIHPKSADTEQLTKVYSLLNQIIQVPHTRKKSDVTGNPFFFNLDGYPSTIVRHIKGRTFPLYETPPRPILKEIVKAYQYLNSDLKKFRFDSDDSSLDFISNMSRTLENISNSNNWIKNQKFLRIELNKDINVFVKNAKTLLQQLQKDCKKFTRQVIHGDIHQENILFEEEGIEYSKTTENLNQNIQIEETEYSNFNFVSFLDFDECSMGYLEMDVIFSALRICKIDKLNPKLVINESEVDYFLQEYDPSILAIYKSNPEQWKAYFALQQSLLYLSHAYYGEWQLTKEMGFIQCFNEVYYYNKNGLPSFLINNNPNCIII